MSTSKMEIVTLLNKIEKDFKYLKSSSVKKYKFYKMLNYFSKIYYDKKKISILSTTVELVDHIKFNINKKESYILSIKNKGEIIMLMGCYPNKKQNYQINEYIFKSPYAKNIPSKKECQNISMLMHSYSSSLFGVKYIFTRPLYEMNLILEKYINNIMKTRDPCKEISCDKNQSNILCDDYWSIITINNELLKIYREYPKLSFNCTCMN